MMGISIQKLLILLAIVAVIFGTGRLKTLGGDLGTALKSFRKAMNAEDAAAAEEERGKSERLTQQTRDG